MGLKDEAACRVAAEEALKAAGVREDMLDRAVRAVDLQPGDDLARAVREAEDLKAELPTLFGPDAPAVRQNTGQTVSQAREAVRASGWDAVTAAAAATAGAQAKGKASNVAKGRQKAAELGWIKS